MFHSNQGCHYTSRQFRQKLWHYYNLGLYTIHDLQLVSHFDIAVDLQDQPQGFSIITAV